jgi:hypothetical protein
MRTIRLLMLLAAGLSTATALAASTTARQTKAADQWWADIAALADDNMAGRLPGTPGFQRATRSSDEPC